MKEEGLTAIYLKADLTDPTTIAALKEKLLKDYKGIDILVNNAGIAFKVLLHDFVIWIKTILNHQQ